MICLSLLLDPLLELTVESTSESKSPAVECPPWGLNINNRKIIKDVRKDKRGKTDNLSPHYDSNTDAS